MTALPADGPPAKLKKVFFAGLGAALSWASASLVPGFIKVTVETNIPINTQIKNL
jgi:hypothetical protein